MDRDEVLRLLDERQVACRAQMKRLREEAERIAGLLDTCHVELERVITARDVVAGLPLLIDSHQERAVTSIGGHELPEFTDRALKVLADHDSAMRCRDLAEALGENAGTRSMERVRHRMKRLVRAGRVTELTPGMFALPGVRGSTTG